MPASPPRLSTASCCSSPASRARSSSCSDGSGAAGLPRSSSRRSRGVSRSPCGPTELRVSDRPYTLLSCGMSIDGYLGSAAPVRLTLSNEADFDRVDAVRADCDAILVGAGTVRNDNPRLLVRSPERRAARVERGRSESPLKVTLTGTGKLDPDAAFFTAGDADKVVYCTSGAAAELQCRLAGLAAVVDAGDPVDVCTVSEDLHARGVERLMVEGG